MLLRQTHLRHGVVPLAKGREQEKHEGGKKEEEEKGGSTYYRGRRWKGGDTRIHSIQYTTYLGSPTVIHCSLNVSYLTCLALSSAPVPFNASQRHPNLALGMQLTHLRSGRPGPECQSHRLDGKSPYYGGGETWTLAGWVQVRWYQAEVIALLGNQCLPPATGLLCW
ncbi:uncharacterized protein LY79DRAFT_256783 [Colletotrichum navitas]|uniref:Uncharacterized protein n=1 Tax=Colletotrichum navitas TaxID=681940 RepID=A0AAD8VA78_9PEZI|nr:uncharacterized protein LY79DRAFT_256783 [Colletotrichum navitas]KAK1598789.1 hypothetical protein LY79DRAFT_256783 [Colletotrichum navitas]